MKGIKEIPLAERPRERIVLQGVKALADVELLAILLGKGTREQDVLSLASSLLATIDKKNVNPSLEDLLAFKGVGIAKATLILAALEFSRRRIRPEGLRITKALDVYSLLRYLADRKQEHFICISLNGAHEVIATRVITVGLVNMCQVHAREVFADPITDRACSIIVAHNHPSGNLEASQQDMDVTARLKKASQVLGINLLDHIIFSTRGFYSFSESGML